MQNQNNSNIVMSRQSGCRSGTPNSMVVLEQGRESPSRPPSGRRSVNRRSPLKKGGSSLEILPAEGEDSNRTQSRLSNNDTTVDSPRQTQSAGSHSRLSFNEDEWDSHDGNGDGRGGAGLKSGSIDGRVEVRTPDSPRKQVYLTTVKRNFEQHGMPKNEELAKAVQNPSSLQNGAISNTPPPNHNSSHRKQQGQRLNRLETDVENNDLKNSDDIEKGLERLAVNEAKGQGSTIKGHDDETGEADSYYISHGSSSNSAKASSGEDDSYYLSHNKASSSTTSETSPTTRGKAEEPAGQTDQSAAVTSTSDSPQTTQDDEDEDEDDEEGKAPFQLLGEFLESVMEEDYENAEKLCKMVLLYEQDNAEAEQFQPLIEEMLKREREAQLWGSESDDDDDDDEDDDDNSDDDDSDDDDSDEDEDDEDSSSSDEDDQEAIEEKPEMHVEK